MGLQLTLPKTDNALYTDFIGAYWKIEGIMFGNMNGEPYMEFQLNAYPTRESSKMVNKDIANTSFNFGGAKAIAYDPCLYRWLATFRTADIFPNGIPLTETEQKDTLYNWVKSYTGLPFIDVLEA